MRSWLARGIHTFGIDSRRLGGRGHARRVLGEDGASALRAAGPWRELASALQRHTLLSALSRLSAAERQIVTLAYLEGRTNRQIAASLGVSVSTVGRRLWLALEHLDEHVRRTGTWVSSILLLGLVYVVDRFARLGRFANAGAATNLSHKLAATVVVSALAAAGFNVVATSLHSSTAKQAPPPAAARLIPGATRSSLAVALPVAPGTSPQITPSFAAITPRVAVVAAAITAASKATKGVSDTPDELTEQGDGASTQSDEVEKMHQVVRIKGHPKGTEPGLPDQRRVIHESSQ
jgi:hypothetical protein